MIKVTNNPEEVLDMSLENIAIVKEQGRKIRVEEIMRAIRILQEAETNAKASKQSRLYLELAVIKMCKIEYDTSSEVMLARINRLESALKSGKIQVVSSGEQNSVNKAAHSNVQQTRNTVVQSRSAVSQATNNLRSEELDINVNSHLTIDDVGRAWTEILEKFKAKRAMIIYASIVTAKPLTLKNGVLTLEYEAIYAFNKARLEKPEYRVAVNEVFSEVLGDKVVVNYVVQEESKVQQDTESILKEKLDGMPFEVYDE